MLQTQPRSQNSGSHWTTEWPTGEHKAHFQLSHHFSLPAWKDHFYFYSKNSTGPSEEHVLIILYSERKGNYFLHEA